jgi:hypothetical protein
MARQILAYEVDYRKKHSSLLGLEVRDDGVVVQAVGANHVLLQGDMV